MNAHMLPIDHPRFRRVQAEIFTRRLVGDCMTHSCRMLDTGAVRIDACCQWGCDVDVAEREAILARSAQIGPLLRPEARAARWFDPEEELCPDYPSGRVVRTEVFEGACIFLAHDKRGCAIHRAALEGGWDLRGVKPAICRLFPLTYEGDALLIAEEYPEFSCSRTEGPTLYQITRDLLGELFGVDLVAQLDATEARATRGGEPARPMVPANR
jgi:Fe-S-cluster containining protein